MVKFTVTLTEEQAVALGALLTCSGLYKFVSTEALIPGDDIDPANEALEVIEEALQDCLPL